MPSLSSPFPTPPGRRRRTRHQPPGQLHIQQLATAWKLMASGYYQAATLILRDIMETTNLVNAFHVDRALIERWRKADRRTPKRNFGPAAVRKILDDAAGLGKSRREAICIKFSRGPDTSC